MSRATAGIIQARMGSTRLPGKVLLPLGGRFELEHVVERVRTASEIDTVVVATSTNKADDIIDWLGDQRSVSVFRGDEEDVLGRMYRAAEAAGADDIVRITADCPLIDPSTVDEVVRKRRESGADYAANIIDRSFPRGLDVEAFTADSFETLHRTVDDPFHREHVTPYYRENDDEFALVNVRSEEVFDDTRLQNRTDLRLTLDEAADYSLLRTVFENVAYESTPPIARAVEYIDAEGLSSVNQSVVQVTEGDASGH